MVWGVCVSNTLLEMQSAEGNIFTLRVKAKMVNFFGYSQTTPRIFGTTVLLNNLTHEILYDLPSNKLDVIEQEFVMGYTIRSDHYLILAAVKRKFTILNHFLSYSFGLLMFMITPPIFSK